ncbi:flavin reductase like domain-containing protein [Terfezia claveryi]|nr:flavin reductase like domain-containing protein [Terfezia claveryi]
MLRLRRGLQAGGLGRTRPPTTAAYIPLRHYAKPHKPVFLVPSRRPLPPPSVKEGIVVDVQSALRSPNISDRVRGVLRHMVHPVVILTTSTSPNPRDWRAITLSSFTSLSLDPHPLITFNVKTPSACATAMHARKRFIVHAMLPTTRAADFAARFSLPYVPGQDWQYAARPNSVEQPLAFIHLGEKEQLLKNEDFTEQEIAEIEGLRKGKTPEVGLSGQFGRIPVLADESTDNLPALWEEVMFRLYCTPERTIPVQDHEIWVAKVERIEYPPHELGSYGIEPHAPLSLLYGDRSFRETGFHLISAHDKFRRWARRKMEYEVGIREEKNRKLLKRLERARRKKAAEEGYAYGELETGKWAVKQLHRMGNGLVEMDSEEAPKSAGKQGEPMEDEHMEDEPMEGKEGETGEINDLDKWMELSDMWRLKKRKILPTPGPDIIPSPPPPVSKLESPSIPPKPKGIKLEEEDEPLEEEEEEEENGRPNRPPATSKPDVTSTNPTPESEPEPQSTPSNSGHSGEPKLSNLRKKLQALTLQLKKPNPTPRFAHHSKTIYTSNPAGSSPENFPLNISPPQNAPPRNSPHQNSPYQNSRPSAPLSTPPQTQANAQEPYLSDSDAECGNSSREDYPKVSTEEKVKEQNKPLHSRPLLCRVHKS